MQLRLTLTWPLFGFLTVRRCAHDDHAVSLHRQPFDFTVAVAVVVARGFLFGRNLTPHAFLSYALVLYNLAVGDGWGEE